MSSSRCFVKFWFSPLLSFFRKRSLLYDVVHCLNLGRRGEIDSLLCPYLFLFVVVFVRDEPLYLSCVSRVPHFHVVEKGIISWPAAFEWWSQGFPRVLHLFVLLHLSVRAVACLQLRLSPRSAAAWSILRHAVVTCP